MTKYQVLATEIRLCLMCIMLCFGAAPTYAATTLIAEFSYDSGLQVTPGSVLPTSVNFSFGTTLGTPETRTNWVSQHTPSDIGVMLFAPSDVVAGVAATVTNPKVIFYMNIGSVPQAFGGYDDLMPPTGDDLGTLRMKLFVPNPTSYRVSSIERTINNVILRWVPSGEGSFYHSGGMQTARLYGELVPEPSASALLFVSACLMFLNRH